MYTSTVYMVYDITITHIRYHCGVLPAKIQHVYKDLSFQEMQI